MGVASQRISYEHFEKQSHGPLTSVIIVATDRGGLSTSSQLNIRVRISQKSTNERYFLQQEFKTILTHKVTMQYLHFR